MKKRKLLIAIGFILLCIVIGVVMFLWKKGDDTEKTQVTVQGTAYAGCGVIYSISENDCYILTAGHILTGMQVGEECKVTFHDGTERIADVFYISDVADLAFLRMQSSVQSADGQGEENGEFAGKVVAMDKSRFDALKEGDEIFACAGGENHTEKITGNVLYPWIYLEDFALNMMLTKLEATSGMSGCGVYDKEGYFVGILCGTSAEGESAILPLSIIESEWSMIAK